MSLKTIHVKVVLKARHEGLVEEGGVYKIYLKAPPVEGKANEALIAFLAEYFHVRKSQVEIIKGLKSRRKTINIKT